MPTTPLLRELLWGADGAHRVRLRDAFVRPLAVAIGAAQADLRRQLGAAAFVPRAAASSAGVAGAPAPPPTPRSSDDALLSRLALLDAAVTPVAELLW